MASTYSSRLRIELIGTGEQSGIWGDTTNTNLGTLIDEAIAGVSAVTMTDANYTLTSNNGATDQARKAVLVLSGTLTATRNVICPSSQKVYIVKNSTTGGQSIVIKTSGGTGITVPNGKTTIVYCDGTDVLSALDALTSLSTSGNVSVGGTLGVSGAATLSSTLGVTGNTTLSGTLGVTGATTLSSTLGVTGATSLSTATTTGNVGIKQASPGSELDVKGTLRLSGSTSGYVGFSPAAAAGSTTYTLPSADGSSGQVLSTNGSGTLSWASGLSASVANTYTAKQTFTGSTSVLAMTLVNALEDITVSATASTGTINFDVTTQSVLYYTTNASGNFTLNFRASSGTSLNTAMAVGESVTVAFLCTNGATAYYNSAVQIDGSSVTPKWQNGSAPSAGNANSVDAYVFTIVKTASATFTVCATQTQFA